MSDGETLLTEDQIDALLGDHWRAVAGDTRHAPTLRDLWVEQCRVARLDGAFEPALDDLRAHFSDFFGGAFR